MANVFVPTSIADAPVGGGGNRPFPAGASQGTLDAVRTRPFPDFVQAGKAGYTSSDGEVLSLQLGDNQGLEGQEIGNQKHFIDFVVRDGDLTASDIDLSEKQCAAWQLQRSSRLLANLAVALGAVEMTDDGVLYDPEEFVAGLQAGVFDGAALGFTTRHRTYARKDGGEGTEVITTGFNEAV